jgi:hypothetical protein
MTEVQFNRRPAFPRGVRCIDERGSGQPRMRIIQPQRAVRGSRACARIVGPITDGSILRWSRCEAMRFFQPNAAGSGEVVRWIF